VTWPWACKRSSRGCGPLETSLITSQRSTRRIEIRINHSGGDFRFVSTSKLLFCVLIGLSNQQGNTRSPIWRRQKSCARGGHRCFLSEAGGSGALAVDADFLIRKAPHPMLCMHASWPETRGDISQTCRSTFISPSRHQTMRSSTARTALTTAAAFRSHLCWGKACVCLAAGSSAFKVRGLSDVDDPSMQR